MITFILKETIASIKKAKGSFLISLTSMSISLFLITLSLFLVDFSGAVQNKLKKNIIINVFINDSLAGSKSDLIRNYLESREDISTVTYISKDSAAQNFIRETGEDFRKLLDYNPLPASFRITVSENLFSPQQLKKTVAEISMVNGVDEVIYGNETAEKIYHLITESKKYVFAATFVLILISIYIIFSTSNLVIKQSLNEMETMKLIGARMSAIKLPVILNSAITGMAAGIISLAIFILFSNSIAGYISQQYSYKFNYFILSGVTILLGFILGVVVSSLTLRKITLRI